MCWSTSTPGCRTRPATGSKRWATDGSLFLDDPWHCVDPVIELRRGDGTERIELERVNPYRLEAENLSAAIQGREPLLLGREDALGQARAIEALYEAADQARTVTL